MYNRNVDLDDYWFQKDYTIKEQLNKVREEIDEVIVEVDDNNTNKIIEEALDVMLASVNLINVIVRDYGEEKVGHIANKWVDKLDEYKRTKYATNKN